MAKSRVLLLNRDRQRFSRTHDYHQFFTTSNGRIQQVPLQHHVMLGMQGDNHGLVFRPLRLVNAARVCEGQLVDLAEFVWDDLAIKVNPEFLFHGVDQSDSTNVPVENKASTITEPIN